MNKKKGQIAVIIALSMTFLFLLFAMVTNITYLVTAKINLQNSVDLAAYAGAAQQARYLTEIGKWNYEMRRNYKAFVYDYVINFNSERGNDFINYLNYYEQVTPAVALTLPRRENPTSLEVKTLFNTTEFNLPAREAKKFLEGMQAVLSFIQPVAPILVTGIKDLIKGINLTTNFLENLSNNYANNMHNYNSRLLNWTVFDYRNLQARIRGVNFTGLEFSNINNRLLSNSKDSPGLKIFNNAPISVAAKVINSYVNNVLEINDNTASNPMHNASYHTFKKNLLNVFSEYKLFYLKPKEPGALVGNNAMGDKACNDQCLEFTGPNLKLDSHDGSFYADFMTAKRDNNSVKISTALRDLAKGIKIVKSPTSTDLVHPYIIDKFPIGVAKDARIKTYYTVLGIANTNNIPFNVFFGEDEESYSMPLIAVASAKPYGSRIGPYIDDNCSSFSNPNNINCKKNGLDPRYPQDKPGGLTEPTVGDNTYSEFLYPDFSTNNNDSNNLRIVNGGVKGTVIDKELLTDVNFQGNRSFLRIFTMGYSNLARYRAPRNRTNDDGFCNTINPACSLTNNTGSIHPYLEDLNVHPQHHRNSIIAWHSNPDANPPSNNNNYDDYLSKLVGRAIHKFPEKRDDNYSLYTFKYPKLGMYWNIGGLVQENLPTAQNSMEFSFANTMAVNEFEIYRYIIPNNYENPDHNVLNWYGVSEGKVFKGLKKYDTRKDLENVLVFDDNDRIFKENNRVLESENNLMESYAAWRTGIRGYKVKLVSINELLEANEFQNTLESSYTIEGFEGEPITIDLSKIAY